MPRLQQEYNLTPTLSMFYKIMFYKIAIAVVFV